MNSLLSKRTVLNTRLRCMSSVPWFVSNDLPVSETTTPTPSSRRPSPIIPLPADAPLPLKALHSRLLDSPFLETSMLLVTRPVSERTDPSLLPVQREASGTRRRRGGTVAGDSVFDVPGGLWSWMMFAQVKEGTESKGTVESVVRQVRKHLAALEPPLPLSPNSRRRMANGWALVDAGDFAIHVISKPVKEKYFSHLSALRQPQLIQEPYTS